MGIYNNINGVFRQVQESLVNVNGVWRSSQEYYNVNGVNRSGTDGTAIEEKNIAGFIFAYRLNKDKTHPEFPHLAYNPKVPAKLSLTGESAGKIDMNSKGVIFEYTNDKPLEEGITMYEGEMYAFLTNGLIINISETKLDPNDLRIICDIPMVRDSWATNRIAYRNIQIWARVSYEFNGLYMNGWNSLLSTEEFIYPKVDPSFNPNFKDSGKNYHLMDEYPILPIESRMETFDKFSRIGITRDMYTRYMNMVGSYGNMNHTITQVTVDGVKKPFTLIIDE